MVNKKHQDVTTLQRPLVKRHCCQCAYCHWPRICHFPSSSINTDRMASPCATLRWKTCPEFLLMFGTKAKSSHGIKDSEWFCSFPWVGKSYLVLLNKIDTCVFLNLKTKSFYFLSLVETCLVLYFPGMVSGTRSRRLKWIFSTKRPVSGVSLNPTRLAG